MFNLTIFFLIVFIIILIFIIIAIFFAYIYETQNKPIPECNQSFGVKLDSTGNVLNQCGDNSLSPCQFSRNSLSAAFQECINQGSKCKQFTYFNGLMQIIDPGTVFTLAGSEVFIKN